MLGRNEAQGGCARAAENPLSTNDGVHQSLQHKVSKLALPGVGNNLPSNQRWKEAFTGSVHHSLCLFTH